MIQQDSSCSSMGACSTRIEIALWSRKHSRDLTAEVLTASWKIECGTLPRMRA